MTESMFNILVLVGLVGGGWFFFKGEEKEKEVFKLAQSKLNRYSLKTMMLRNIEKSLRWNEKVFGHRAISPVIIIFSFLSSISLFSAYYYGIRLYGFKHAGGGIYFMVFVLFSIVLAVVSRITTRYFLEKSIRSVKYSIIFLMLDALFMLMAIGMPLTMAIFIDDVVSGNFDTSIVNYIEAGYRLSLLPYSYPLIKESGSAIYSLHLLLMLFIFSSSILPSIFHIFLIFRGLIIRAALSLLNLITLTLLRLSPFNRPFMSFFGFLVVVGGALSDIKLL